MAVKDRHVDKNSRMVEKVLLIQPTTAISLSGAVVFSLLLGYRYQIKRVRTFCRTKAGTVTAALKVGTRTAASCTFTAATEVAITPSATLANVRGSASEAITLELTTDGSGALTNALVAVTLRAYPLQGEASSGTNTP